MPLEFTRMSDIIRGVAMSVRRLRMRSRSEHGGSPQSVPTYAGQPAAAQPDPWAAYPVPQGAPPVLAAPWYPTRPNPGPEYLPPPPQQPAAASSAPWDSAPP